MPDSTQRFSNRVENYVRYRPSYPAELIRTLRQRAALSTDSVIADIGSGTGILTTLLLPIAGTVHAIEPNAEMRGAAESALGATSGFSSHNATAEHTALTAHSVDLITAGQAFHWFDVPAARAEFSRILKPGGQVALIWNERLSDTTPFLKGYERLLRTAGTDYEQVNHTRIDANVIARFYAPGPFSEITFPNAQQFDLAGLTGRALSSSYVPGPGQAGHGEFVAALQRLFSEHAVNGLVSLDYLTRLYLGPLA